MNRSGFIKVLWLTASVLLLVAAAALVWNIVKPRLTEEEVQTLVISTIQREAPASFYVTGTLDITAEAEVTINKVLLPRSINLKLQSTTANVKLPGRASYGFDVSALRREDIRLEEDGAVTVHLPSISVYAVESDLSRMEVETEDGWQRLYSDAGSRAELMAMSHAQDVLEAQAGSHIRTADQPRINTAHALETLLRPILQAAGVEDPQFRFDLGGGLVVEPRG